MAWRFTAGAFAVTPRRESFIRLQEDRLTADYDNHAQWTITDVLALLQIVDSAFEDWQSIRTDPMAGNYLLAMLLGKQL